MTALSHFGLARPAHFERIDRLRAARSVAGLGDLHAQQGIDHTRLAQIQRPRNAISGSVGAGKRLGSLTDVTNRDRTRIKQSAVRKKNLQLGSNWSPMEARVTDVEEMPGGDRSQLLRRDSPPHAQLLNGAVNYGLDFCRVLYLAAFG